ncbi:MAG: hypothetical protein Q7S96_04700 [bacterium]|nr:hypothetical protein [bacterium]
MENIVQRLNKPRAILAIGAVVFVGIVLLAAHERASQAVARTLTPGDVTLTDVERSALDADIAAAYVELADDDDKNDFNAYVKIALAKEDLGDREGAAAIYRDMNERYAGNYLSFQNLGILYQEDKKCELASEQFLRAIANAPRIAHHYRNIVNLYTYDCPEYVHDIPVVLQDGLAIMPNSVDILSLMAVYHRDFGTIEDAIHWYEFLLVYDQENRTAIDEVRELREQLRGI